MVMDIVYQPLQTRLLREAKEKGCLTINGLEMLVRQGAAQLMIWTGRRPDVKQIRDGLYKALPLRIPLPSGERGSLPAGRGEGAVSAAERR
jgi:hypothetical protein